MRKTKRYHAKRLFADCVFRLVKLQTEVSLSGIVECMKLHSYDILSLQDGDGNYL